MQHANKTDIAIFLICICPTAALIYVCCYYMLLNIHEREYEYWTFAMYGFIQFSIGYVAGYCVSKYIYHITATASVEEEFPLLPVSEINPPLSSVDIEET